MRKNKKQKNKIKTVVENIFLALIISGLYGFSFAYGLIQYCVR